MPPNPFGQSVDDRTYLFGGIEQSGYASVQSLADKTGPVTAEGLLSIVREIRIAADPAVQLQVHIHSDKDKSIVEGAVKKLITDNGWGQTTTVGYDHNANPRIERRWH